jgi:hypothetical protein
MHLSRMATSSTIFKIKATSDFYADPFQTTVLSFRKGQAFYALSLNEETNSYFVSTQFSTPFARGAITGTVPADYFVIQDNFGNKLPSSIYRKTQLVAPTQNAVNRVPQKIADIMSTPQQYAVPTPAAVSKPEKSMNTKL